MICAETLARPAKAYAVAENSLAGRVFSLAKRIGLLRGLYASLSQPGLHICLTPAKWKAWAEVSRCRQGVRLSFGAAKDCGGTQLEDCCEVVRVEVGGRWRLHPEYRERIFHRDRASLSIQSTHHSFGRCKFLTHLAASFRNNASVSILPTSTEKHPT